MSGIGLCGIPVATSALVIWGIGLTVAIGGMLWFVRRLDNQG